MGDVLLQCLVMWLICKRHGLTKPTCAHLVDVTEGLLTQSVTQHVGYHLLCSLSSAALNTNSSAKICNVNHDVACVTDCPFGNTYNGIMRINRKVLQQLTCTVESADVEAARRQVLILSA